MGMSITIGSMTAIPGAWCRVANPTELWLPAQQRGDDIVQAAVNGEHPVRRWKAATRRQLELWVSGNAIYSGSPKSTPAATLQANVEHIKATVAPASGDGTRSVTVTSDWGTATGSVHVIGLRFGRVDERGAWLSAVLELSIPAGEITWTVAP